MAADILLDTATDQFGRLGFEGASTRAIASASGTAMSAITYHFGGKKGLYLAVAKHIASQIAERQAPLLEATESRFAADPGAVAEILADFMAGFGWMMIAPESERWARFIIREQQEPSEAFELLYHGVMEQILALIVRLATAARPDLSLPDVRAIAVQLMGQALVLRSGRASVCRIMEVDGLDGAVVEVLIARLKANVRAILLPEGQKR